MESLRKWFYRPKKDDPSLLAQFFHADEALNLIAGELDSFDGRKDPERCTALVNQLRQAQDRVLTITNAIMDALIGCAGAERANREFRVKFPEDVLQDNLAGQLWFGAECLAAGSSIMNREQESAEMRPLAKALTKSLETVRNLLRDTCLRNTPPSENLLESLKIFDRLFADFELKYVSAMVPVKTVQEHELQEMIGVLFSETLQRALKMKLLTQDLVDDCDPALMFTIPRLAIITGLLIFPNGPLNPDRSPENMSELFRPFRALLLKIRELLWTLDKRELYLLEKLLGDNDQSLEVHQQALDSYLGGEDFVKVFYEENPGVREYVEGKVAAGIENNSKLNTYSTSPPSDLILKQLYPHTSNNNNNNNTNNNNSSVTSDSIDVIGRKTSETIDIPSTSGNVGYLLTNTIDHDAIAGTNSSSNPHAEHARVESLPDHDSLQVISVAAATLTSYLSTASHHDDVITSHISPSSSHVIKSDVESATDDSGICTENTSLDRSPSLDLNECSDSSPKSALYLSMSQQQQPECDKCVSRSIEHGVQSQFEVDAEDSSSVPHGSSNEHGAQSEFEVETNSSSSEPIGSPTTPSAPTDCQSKVESSSSESTPTSTKCDICDRIVTGSLLIAYSRTGRQVFRCDKCVTCKRHHHHHHHRKSSSDKSRHHHHRKSGAEGDCDSSSVGSTDTTSSFNSTCADDEEIALAMQAVEIANRNEVRAKFRNSEDLIHRLYVCISGVADQLQTNFASDLRNILKSVFLMNTSPDTPPTPTSPTPDINNIMTQSNNSLESSIDFHEYHPITTEVVRGEFTVDPNILAQEALFDSNVYFHLAGEGVEGEAGDEGGEGEGEEGGGYSNRPRFGVRRGVEEEREENCDIESPPNVISSSNDTLERPPVWIPDIEAPKCMSCAANFTVVKRRHHCRNCGKVFCARCSSNSAPLPKYGHVKPVRVCNRCFMYDLAPFTR